MDSYTRLVRLADDVETLVILAEEEEDESLEPEIESTVQALRRKPGRAGAAEHAFRSG